MKYPNSIRILICICFTYIFLTSACSSSDSGVTIKVLPTSLGVELPRYGLNLGGTGTYGAEQLRSNIVANPGFESILDRAIVIVDQVGPRSFTDDTNWLARTKGFWAGGSFDIRSGILAGRQGKILDSARISENGPDQFFTDTTVLGLGKGDVVAVSGEVDPAIAPNWWKSGGRISVSKDIPPASSGQKSVRLLAIPSQTTEIIQYFDAISDRAGKLLLVNGKWRLAFWAKQAGKTASLKLYFGRQQSMPFFNTEITPDTSWKYYEFEFDAIDAGPPGVLTLAMLASNDEVLIDDVYLGESSPGPGGFRNAVVETLKTLHPGFLRDWQGQLGDTFTNRVSDSLAHKPTRYRPGNEYQIQYGLTDFFALCKAINAQPWIVAPSTLSDEEWTKFGSYLHQAADEYGFTDIMVEFGNENWNSIFRPGGIPDPITLGQVSDRGFKLLRDGSGNDKRLKMVLGALFAWADNVKLTGVYSKQSDRLAIGPYFMYKLDAGTSISDAIKLSFADDDSLLGQEEAVAKSQGKSLSVYEVNFHTTLGTANSELRNIVVTSGASGAALGRRLMQASLVGIREQAVYSFSGLDSFFGDSKDLVRIWGVTRDLSVPNRLRPTGLALAMLNRIVAGKPRLTDCSGKFCALMTSLAFDDGKSIALVSANSVAVPVKLDLGCASGESYALKLLDGSDPMRNNEQQPQVSVVDQVVTCQKGQIGFTVQPYSLITLEKATK